LKTRIFIFVVGVLALGLWAADRQYFLYQRFVHPEEFYFVTVKGRDFYLEGEPFRFVGANTRLLHGRRERAAVVEALDSMNARDLRVVRQWVIGEATSADSAEHRPVEQFYFQVGPGGWQEQSFAHLDTLLAVASSRDIKVILTLFNNWRDYGGMPMYLHWADIGIDPRSYAYHDSFYVDSRTKEYAKNFIEKVVARRNTVTGVLYRDDPTIFAWELVNEAHAEFDQFEAMQQWLAEMATYVKVLDANHLVSSSFSLYERALVREHIVESIQMPELDYADIHMYPAAYHQRFLFAGDQALEQVVDDLVRLAHYAAKKPLLIGEVGFSRWDAWKEQPREYWYERLLESAFAAGASGVLAWSYSDPKWEDSFEINWREEEHAALCSLLAIEGRRFALDKEPLRARPVAEGDWTFRVEIPEQAYKREAVLPLRRANVYIYQIAIDSYTKARWINSGYWDGAERGFASVYAKDDGYFEYAFAADSAAVLSARLRVRLSTDFPPIANADSLGRSNVTVRLNGVVLGQIEVVPRRYYGTVYELAIERGEDAPLCYLLPEGNMLRFAVEADAEHRNGIALLGTAVGETRGEREMPIELQLSVR
jgi:mannan endo-1,4-beta-mannosidase